MNAQTPVINAAAIALDKEDSLAFRLLTPILTIAEERIPDLGPLPDNDDTGNGQIFNKLFDGSVCRIIDGSWMVFDHERRLWERDEKGDLVRCLGMKVSEVRKLVLNLSDMKAVKFAQYTASRPGIDNLVRMAGFSIDFMKERSSFDSHLDEILDASGYVFDLKTGEFRIASTIDRWTKAVRASTISTATCPKWNAFLEEVLPDPEVRQFLQVFFGYCLSGKTSEHVLVVFHGTGANGKSILLNTIQAILGDYARNLSPELLLPTKDSKVPPHELAELLGLRLACFSETGEGGRLNEAAMKAITGDDQIAACRKYEAPFSFSPSHKSVLMTNHIPRIRSVDDGTWRRLLVVRFPVTIPEEKRNKNLAAELLKEAPAIFQWMLDGAKEWYKSGLPKPTAVLRETAEYRKAEDNLADFIDDQQVGPDLRAPSSRLYDLYRNWLESEGDGKPMSTQAFKREMEQHRFSQEKTRDGRFFLGISLEKNCDTNPSQPLKPPIRAYEGEFRDRDTYPSQDTHEAEPPF